MPELPYDAGQTSHAALIALLMHLGGSADVPAVAFAPEATGTPDGEFHALRMDPLPDGRIRLSVVARPDVAEAGVRLVPDSRRAAVKAYIRLHKALAAAVSEGSGRSEAEAVSAAAREANATLAESGMTDAELMAAVREAGFDLGS